MDGFRKILRRFGGSRWGRRGVSSAEYAILAVGIVIVVGGAIALFDLNNPMNFAGSALTSTQASLSAGAR